MNFYLTLKLNNHQFIISYVINIMEYLIFILFVIIISIATITLISAVLKVKYNKEVKYVYRYVPKKYLDQQYEDNYANELFKSLFTTTSPWLVDSVRYRDEKKMETVNKYFVNQV